MKTIVIGDIHGRNIWKKIIEKHSNFDRVIFLGDYFDTKENITAAEQLYNFEEICRFAKNDLLSITEREIILLLGNHDYHYWPGIEGGNTSGYQRHSAPAFTKALDDNKHLFKMAYVDENNYVYSHAGISKTWIEDMGLLVNRNIKDVVDDINDVFFYRPAAFGYYQLDGSGYGQNKHQSPIWIRPESLSRVDIDYTQFVGHTIQDHINQYGRIWLIDALGTSQEFIVLDGGIVMIDKI